MKFRAKAVQKLSRSYKSSSGALPRSSGHRPAFAKRLLLDFKCRIAVPKVASSQVRHAAWRSMQQFLMLRSNEDRDAGREVKKRQGWEKLPVLGSRAGSSVEALAN